MQIENTQNISLSPEELKEAVKDYLIKNNVKGTPEINFVVKDCGVDDDDRMPYCPSYQLTEVKVKVTN